MADAHRGYGRTVQSEVYRAGLSARARRPGRRRRARARGTQGRFVRGLRLPRRRRRRGGDHGREPRRVRALAGLAAGAARRAERDLSIELLGRRRATPFLLSPIGVAELAHADADVAVGRAASALDVPYVLRTRRPARWRRSPPRWARGSRWFQLYWSASDELNASFLRRAEAAGCEAVVVTLDTHLLGWRTRDLDAAYLPFTRGQGIAQYTSDPVFAELVRERVARGGGGGPRPKVTPTLLASALRIARSGAGTRLVEGGVRDALRSPLPRAAVETFLDVFSDPSLTWDDLARLREWTTLPVLLKGILHPDDASRALDAGVDGIVVSNHGGRQVDARSPPSTRCPRRRAGRGRVPVMLDSGVRGGADAFIALALGATAVGIGRPYAYGLAVAGDDGVREVVRNHIAELDLTMALAGHRSIAEIGRDSLRAAVTS